MALFQSSRPQLTKQNKPSISVRMVLSISAFTILVGLWIANDYQQPYYIYSAEFNTFDEEQNSLQIKEWREKTQKVCQAIIDQPNVKDHNLRVEAKEALEVEAMKMFVLPEQQQRNLREEVLVSHKKYEPCRNAFIDLGTNIGDSIGYFVDSAFDVCSPLWSEKFPGTRMNEQFPHPHLDISDFNIYNKGYGINPLRGMMRKYMKADPPMFPEDTCVYGMEGNPTFTERLKKLERTIMDMKPRPVRHLHIHTESVVTEEDRPTKLYLDKTSVEQNFWGSSILRSQQDAVKTANELNDGKAISADVDGIRLTTLIKSTMLPFQPEASEKDKTGGQLIVKMDIEGAEYQVIKEIAKSNVLCDYIRMGNKVVLIVETHNMSITDVTERRTQKQGYEDAKKQLEACGVTFGKLHAHWS